MISESLLLSFETPQEYIKWITYLSSPDKYNEDSVMKGSNAFVSAEFEVRNTPPALQTTISPN